MDVRAIDLSATTGESRLHRASPITKLVAFAFVLTAVVVQQNLFAVLACLLLLVALAIAMRLPLRQVFGLAAYPGVFAVVFALAAAPDLLTGALFTVRAVAASLGAIVLLFVTPYPQLFAPMQRVLPDVAGDALLMTYRSLFLLAEKFERLRIAIRLRSGLTRGHPIRAARATAGALGSLVLYALDLSQREYDVMRLRGYVGRLKVTLPRAGSRAFDASLIASAAAVLATALAFRVAGAALTPWSWLLAAAAAIGLLATIAGRVISR
jgi:cobalt/nickel transport system permease protein